jgi:hypothetical protein
MLEYVIIFIAGVALGVCLEHRARKFFEKNNKEK